MSIHLSFSPAFQWHWHIYPPPQAVLGHPGHCKQQHIFFQPTQHHLNTFTTPLPRLFCFYWQMESWLIQLFRRGYHKNSHLSGIDINCYWHTSLIASILLHFASKLRIIKILTGQQELGGNCYPIVFSSNGTLYRVRNFKGLHQISSRETQISRDISNC